MGIVTLWHRKISWSAVASRTIAWEISLWLHCMFFVFRFLFGLDGYLGSLFQAFFTQTLRWAQGKAAMEAKVWPHRSQLLTVHLSTHLSFPTHLIFSSYEERLLKIRQSLHDFDWFRNFVINHCTLQLYKSTDIKVVYQNCHYKIMDKMIKS